MLDSTRKSLFIFFYCSVFVIAAGVRKIGVLAFRLQSVIYPSFDWLHPQGPYWILDINTPKIHHGRHEPNVGGRWAGRSFCDFELRSKNNWSLSTSRLMSVARSLTSGAEGLLYRTAWDFSDLPISLGIWSSSEKICLINTRIVS